jgi:hypothetical protein
LNSIVDRVAKKKAGRTSLDITLFSAPNYDEWRSKPGYAEEAREPYKTGLEDLMRGGTEYNYTKFTYDLTNISDNFFILKGTVWLP